MDAGTSDGGKTPEAADMHDWDLLSKASAVLSGEFTRMLDDFADEYGEVFRDAVEGSDEHKFEYDEVHKQFAARVEGRLESFIEDEDADAGGFLEECRASLADEWCALFEEDVNKPFVLMVLGMSEYSKFHELMVEAVRGKIKSKK